MTSILSRAWSLMSPVKPVAPQTAEAAATAPPTTNAPTPATEQETEQDFFGQNRQKSTPRSLFSDKESEYMPGSKRKFELDFESPKTAKKAKMETLASFNSKRKRELEFETPQKRSKASTLPQTMPPMPRSAMKPLIQPRTPATGKKSVTFGRQPLTDTKIVRPLFGKAGNYKGSVFADSSPVPFSSPEASTSTPSTISDTGSSQLEMSPTTKSNTDGNTPGARSVFCEDPYDPYWRPQPHNPRPGQFCLPDDLSLYDDEEEGSNIFEQSTPVHSNTNIGGSNTASTPDTIRQGYNAVFPDSPQTPRLSHSQLPATTSQGAQASTSTGTSSTPTQLSYSTPPTTSTILAEADTSAVLKARAAAEKYKPASFGKQASKLSQVTSARSRSSSPPRSRGDTPGSGIDPALAAQNNEPVTIELEQHLDKWARNLSWPAPGEKIVEEEAFNNEMMGQIRAEWTTEDDEQSQTFWDREFERVVEAGRRADRTGKVLMFV